MAKQLTISVADSVMEKIENKLKILNRNNKSEFVEECIRIGLNEFGKEVDNDGDIDRQD